MGYAYQQSETVSEGIKRVALEKCDDIIGFLQQDDNIDEGVHSARKSFKQLRAALRLVRPGMASSTYDYENAAYRDASRLLAPLRDGWVIIEVLDTLTKRFDDSSLKKVSKPIRAALLEDYNATHSELLAQGDVRAEVIDMVEDCKTRIPDWQIEPDDFSIVMAGAGKIYRQGMARFHTAYDEKRDIMLFHEWRKSVKYLWYHLQLLQPTAPELLKLMLVDLKAISDHVGLAHDIVGLYERIQTMPETQRGAGRTLLARMDYAQAQLEQEAQILAESVYAEQPGAFEARLKIYWDTWQRQPA